MSSNLTWPANLSIMIVDNFKQIAEILPEAENPRDSMFLIQLVVRHKDGHLDAANGNNRNRTIRSYQINTKEELLKKEKEIKALCDFFRARAYININPKNTVEVLLKQMELINSTLKCMWQGDHKFMLRGTLDGALARTGEDDVEFGDVDPQDLALIQTLAEKRHRTWVVDCDDLSTVEDVRNRILSSKRSIENVIVAEIPTVSGLHFITYPFNYLEVFEGLENRPEIKKNSYTLLYFNNEVEGYIE